MSQAQNTSYTSAQRIFNCSLAQTRGDPISPQPTAAKVNCRLISVRVLISSSSPVCLPVRLQQLGS